MVGRTKAEAAATREALIDSALRMFRSHGVAHTSLADIATAAGVTRGAVYWHFRDKADLFEALCACVELPMETMLVSAGEKLHKDPLGALEALAVNGLTRLATDARTQAVFDIIFHKCEFAAELASVAERRNAADRGCLANVERLLLQAVTLGQLPPDTDTRIAAQSMSAFMVGVMHEWVQRPDVFDLAATAPMMIDMFIAGLRTCPPRRAAALSRAKGPRRRRLSIAG